MSGPFNSQNAHNNAHIQNDPDSQHDHTVFQGARNFNQNQPVFNMIQGVTAVNMNYHQNTQYHGNLLSILRLDSNPWDKGSSGEGLGLLLNRYVAKGASYDFRHPGLLIIDKLWIHTKF
ncbi:hypothetical protein BDP27DRAFT_1426751 [Rhodocollybia butyracea]|uniref:Uncharacterized protein n=1 Tax=Rhodocollybia butyracea TaxID=206335 RepID=A0A9P5U1F2_9AGAR|nr:hypothetical protein BDP27DRAFT_1426751 [Rhodocollybia butyracea]